MPTPGQPVARALLLVVILSDSEDPASAIADLTDSRWRCGARRRNDSGGVTGDRVLGLAHGGQNGQVPGLGMSMRCVTPGGTSKYVSHISVFDVVLRFFARCA